MSYSINTNIISLATQNSLEKNQSGLATTIQRLSTGLRINSGADDPAGLAIAARMTAQINGVNQAARNANDGTSLTQTANGGLQTISTMLQSMRTLAVQAANGTNTASDRASIQAEISQLQSEVNQVANRTQYNGANILDGSFTNGQFQVGANANQTINVSIGNAQASSIGNNVVRANAATAATTLTQAHLGSANNTIAANVFLAQAITLQGNGTSVTIPNTTLTIGSSGAAVASAVNSASGTTGIKATATTTATLGGFAAGTVSLSLQGAPTAAGAANPVTVSATLATSTDLSGLTNAINAQTGSTGITAIANLTNGTISLNQSQGYDIGVANLTTQGGITVTGTTSAGAAGTAVTLGTAAATTNTATIGAAVSFNAATSFTVSSSVSTSGIFDVASTASGSTLSSVSSIDVTSLTNGIPTGANNALSIIDAALNNISASQANLGALQNRFSYVVNNLNSTALNLTNARSGVQDTNFGTETANLSRSQILQQASTAMLAQANSLPNGVLSLLR